jgi:hypothetical protein
MPFPTLTAAAAVRLAAPLERAVLVALLLPPMLLVVLATLPALAVLPFLPEGERRTASLLRLHTAAARTLLAGTR